MVLPEATRRNRQCCQLTGWVEAEAKNLDLEEVEEAGSEGDAACEVHGELAEAAGELEFGDWLPLVAHQQQSRVVASGSWRRAGQASNNR